MNEKFLVMEEFLPPPAGACSTSSPSASPSPSQAGFFLQERGGGGGGGSHSDAGFLGEAAQQAEASPQAPPLASDYSSCITHGNGNGTSSSNGSHNYNHNPNHSENGSHGGSEFLNPKPEKRQKLETSSSLLGTGGVKVKQEYEDGIDGSFAGGSMAYPNSNLAFPTTPFAYLNSLSNPLRDNSEKEAPPPKATEAANFHEPPYSAETQLKLSFFGNPNGVHPTKASPPVESFSESPVRLNVEKEAVAPSRAHLSPDARSELDADPVRPLQAEKGNTILGPLSGSFSSRQFWHAGDYEIKEKDSRLQKGGMDHVRVHPKFLHSNATSHKWALGAIAELLDNAMDEVCHGATYVDVDMILNPNDNQPMLLIQDDGGGMNPDRMRSCLSLGYSEKSKKANTIGQYGNGFKTSTMRLGADVVVFSKSPGYGGNNETQSIGLLSFTFLRDTGKEDIIVPMIDYEMVDGRLEKIIRSTEDDFDDNLKTIVKWSPYFSEDDLLQQFDDIEEHGTKIIVYNLWLTDEGDLELDFDTDPEDIQVRGARDPAKLKMAQKYPNSHHYLTYAHSLRSYASILYLRRPQNFRIYLRGKEVVHHNLVDDLMHIEEVVYRPKGEERETGMMAVVTIGFVKDAKEHIDVQGFNVYHKNRLIKPFWKIWNASSSQGRGVIGVLEANFVEPAHDKQGFERTQVLQRLEHRLLQMQKSYWNQKSYLVGYISAKQNKILNMVHTMNMNGNNINNPIGLSHSLNNRSYNKSNYSSLNGNEDKAADKLWGERAKPKFSTFEQKVKGSCLLPLHPIKDKHLNEYQLIPFDNENSSGDPLVTLHLQEENQYLRLRCGELEKYETENQKMKDQVVLLEKQISDIKHEREKEQALYKASSSSQNLLKTQLKAALRRVRILEEELRSKNDVEELS